MRKLPALLVLLALLSGVASFPVWLDSRVAVHPDFVHFESAPVHPLAITPDGTRLLVVNTPDGRLSVFDLTGAAPVRIAEIPVGMEPVSVAARNDHEAWVVNTLSDDVSIVDLDALDVRATLRVGDEPADVVFAGNEAWVSVAQEDVLKVYDAGAPGAPLAIVPVNLRMPSALAVSADGANVFVAAFHGSNRTTVISAAEVGPQVPIVAPPMRAGLPPAPATGLILHRSLMGNWLDNAGHIWNSRVPYDVQIQEVQQIRTATRTVVRGWADIASNLMGCAANPVTGEVAVSGTYYNNDSRFVSNLSGRLVEARVGVVTPDGGHAMRQLNLQIDYRYTPGPPSDADSALGNPCGVAWSADGERLFVAALANDRIGVLNRIGTPLARVPAVAGTAALIADPQRPRLYVLGRYHNQLQTLSTANFAQVALQSIGFDPTPDDIVNGRKFFYGGFTSGHGDQACASCHLFGDTDHLGWDLGDPRGDMAPAPPGMDDPQLAEFHPMKGPMFTQTLRGLQGTGVLHWRGDRADLNAFNPAFVALMGRSRALADSEMTALGDFILALANPPNPHRALDGSLPADAPGTASARRGQKFFFNPPIGAARACAGCHASPAGTNGQVISRGVLGGTQDLKVPQLRNIYRKSGFRDTLGVVNRSGFGFGHDGTVDRLDTFIRAHFMGAGFGGDRDAEARDLAAFVRAFDTGFAPAVGTQVTLDGGAGDAAGGARLDTLEAQANDGRCDLVARARPGGTPRSWKFLGERRWQSDRADAPSWTTAELKSLAHGGQPVTFTAVPLGSGTRLGLDRDRDGLFDGDELALGSDPGDPASVATAAATSGGAIASGLGPAAPNPFRAATGVSFALAREDAVDLRIYDVLGREVRALARGERYAAGRHLLPWDGRRSDGGPAGAGAYFLRMRTRDGHWTRMVVRLP